MKRVTIKDIAEMLNISVSTVSRALKDHPDISNAVKLKVKEAAETFNYIPNDFAINFRKKSSKVIGLIIPEMSMFFIPSIIKGISSVLHREGYHFFLLSSEESLMREKENIITCINSRVDGILISLTRYTKDLSHLQKARDIELPVVIFDKTISQNHFDEIIFDNGLNAGMAAEKLIESQCESILAVFGDENLEITQTRRDFFLEKLKDNPDIQCKVIYCKSADEVKDKLSTILEYEHFDGYFAMSDETLAGLHSSLVKNKLQASAVKVIAITEGILPKYLDDSYECIINDGYSMGTMAASKILEIIKGS
ncbi:LacI family transcriptional regulator [Chryseobacterium sp. B21-037]|uniref:LacI family DNA-binding transcriptional regulator n=1 Tax=unclassified Chryseobacterium TaxID=2593645 RepID=UPI0023594F95|nr:MULTISPECIES: LacI family DNA-binding transcriptional regulator [unclassified Chryseobacterium]MDC8104542.1 LacI family transcriptional regulator [Chryseobacterium sp. B21-037]MDQ1804150.1 LacI family DNA-binding transcriptional regulator [Chryseobacterium sp. CKR4-1]